METTSADLTISLSRPAVPPAAGGGAPAGADEPLYLVQLAYFKPDSTEEIPPVQAFIHLPARAELLGAADRPELYGGMLRAALFADPTIARFYHDCEVSAATANAALRLRVLIHPSAAELHDWRWETLRDPEDRDFAALQAARPFSRFFSAPDWRGIELREKGQLKALIAAANPAILAAGGLNIGRELAPVPVEDEVARATAALRGVQPPAVLRSDQAPVTLAALRAALADGVDILYLVCHGALRPLDRAQPNGAKQAVLLLEKDNGDRAWVPAAELADFIRSLDPARRPRLVALASCQSAGKGEPAAPGQPPPATRDNGELSAAAPLLVEAGVPAVLAMQGNVTMETVELFIPRFFEELLRHGQVDRAAAVARSLARGRPDWWAPVVYLRLRAGKLWYEPGFFQSKTSDDDLFHTIALYIQHDRAIPVLGPGLLDGWLDPPQAIAAEWAKSASFPLAAHEQWQMPQVAQYLANQFGLDRPRLDLEGRIHKALNARCAELGVPPDTRPLDDLLAEAYHQIAERSEQSALYDPYDLLARLPFSIYINACPNLLLEKALAARGRPPKTLVFNWQGSSRAAALAAQGTGAVMAEVAALEDMAAPTPRQPLLFYIFGDPREPGTWVLSEDDYFEYLMAVQLAATDNRMPETLRNQLSAKSLLFLGFQMKDWDFRVLFRSIFNAQRLDRIGGQARAQSVAVQIQPGDDYLHPAAARDYLLKFYKSHIFNLYLGSTRDFLTRLWEKAKE